MSDMIDAFHDLKAVRKAERDKFGLPCPRCTQLQPKRNPTILLPGRRCRVDGYVDQRPDLTKEQFDTIFDTMFD